MAFAAGRTTRLKFGMSVMVLPGRNPVVVAKELATLDRLSGGRLLPAFGLGVADPHEQQAFGVERGERAAWFDEALPLIRGCWTEDASPTTAPASTTTALRVLPKPRQQPPDVWLGGIAPSELRRVGRLADGWLPSFVHARRRGAPGREVIEQAAAEHDRDDRRRALRRCSSPTRWTACPTRCWPRWPARPARPRRPRRARAPGLGGAASPRRGASLPPARRKFVVLPLVEPASAVAWTDHLAEAAEVLLPLQT